MKNSSSATEGTSPSEVAERLRSLVESAGGPSAVARKAGVPLSTLNEYFAGTELKLARAVALARACGVSVELLATGKSETVGFPIEDDLLDSAAHFWGILMGVRTAREWYKGSGIQPSLRDVLIWMSPVYRSALSLPDLPIEFRSP